MLGVTAVAVYKCVCQEIDVSCRVIELQKREKRQSETEWSDDLGQDDPSLAVVVQKQRTRFLSQECSGSEMSNRIWRDRSKKEIENQLTRVRTEKVQ